MSSLHVDLQLSDSGTTRVLFMAKLASASNALQLPLTAATIPASSF